MSQTHSEQVVYVRFIKCPQEMPRYGPLYLPEVVLKPGEDVVTVLGEHGRDVTIVVRGTRDA